jgi:Na+-driven multidrug efflux pump
MGIAGAAWATFLSRLAMVAVTLVYLAGPLELLKLTLPRDGELLESWKEILYVGIPAASTSLLFPIAIGVVTRLVSRYGEAAVGALGAGQRVDSIVMVAYWAMSRVEAPMAGQNYGAGRMRRVHEAQRSGTVLALAWGGLCLIVLWAGADLFAHVLVGEPGVWDPLVLYLRISAVGLGFRGLTVLGGAFFSALKHPLPAATIDIVRMFLLTLPLAWVGDRLGGVAGIFAGVAAANVLAGMLAAGATERFSRRLLGRKIITEVMSVEDS